MSKIVGRRPIEIKLSDQLNGYIPVFNSTTRLWSTINKTDIITGSATISGSNIFTGDQTNSGSLTVVQGITGSLFGTASYASNAWAVGGNNLIGGDSYRILGTLSDHGLSIYASGSRIATFSTSGSFILGPSLPSPANALVEAKFTIEAGVTSQYNLIKATSNVNNYSQFSIQNQNTGSNASSDIVAIADNGSESNNYINLGINSSTFTGNLGGHAEIGDANDAYLYSTGNDLHIGNASNYPVQFFAGGANTDTNRKLQLNPNNLHQMTGSLDVSGSVVAPSFTGSLLGTSSYAAQALTASNATTASSADDFTIRGTLTAQTIVAQTITSSIEFITGSTRNGSLLTNTHQFTGSVDITGSLTVNGRNYINDSSSFSSRVTTNSSSFASFSGSYVDESSSFAGRITTNSSSLANFSGSYINESSSFTGRITTNSSSFANFSGSYINESSSFTGRITTNSSSFANFSGSYVNESSSFASRITNNSSSFASFSGSYVNESSSFASRITTNSSSFANFSGSYVNESSSFASRISTNSSSFASFSGSYVNDSSSFASRITTNSASISTLSASFNSFSGSFMTGSFTGSFTGSVLGTSSYAIQALTASNAATASSADNFTVRGTLTAQTIVAQTITSSIEYITGSTQFGSLLPTDTHQFTGSVNVTGSLEVNGRNYINDSSSFASRITTNSSSFASFSGSYVNESSSFASRITTDSASFTTFSGSYVSESSSFASRITTNSSSFASFSGSYVNESSSFASRITTNSSSFASFSGSYVNESSSFASRITTNSASFTTFSGSYVNESSSFASQIATNSASFTTFSGSYINESSSFASRITTNSASFTTFSGSYINESSSFASRITTNSASLASFSGSYVNESSSFASRITTNSSSFASFSGSYINESSSFASRITTNSASFTTFSGSYINESSSFASRITTDSASFTTFSGSYISESSSFASRIATDSASLASFSGSYVNESSSFANRITTNSSSFASFSGSYISESSSFDFRINNISSSLGSFSSSFSTGSFTGSFTGSLLGTSSYATQALTASNANTASSADDFTVRGTLTAQTIVAQTITSSIEFITGSTRNGSLLTNTHQFTGSVGITGSLAINGIDYNTTSGSTSTRLTTLETFSGSFSTGSFTGSFIGRHTGSFSGSLYNLQNTVLGHIPFFSSSQVLADSIVRQLDNGSGSYSIVINQDNITTAAPEALYVWQPSDTSYNVIAGKGNLNSYLQLNIQNTNTGENASSDVVATANNGNESINYIDMGINSEGFTGSIGDANDAYLYSTGNHLHIGNASNQYVGFFAGGPDVDTNMKLILSPDNQHEITGSLSITEKLNVLGGVTASLQGTASWANNAVTASYITQAQSASYWSGSIINAATASYVLNAQSASYWSGSITNAATASYIETAQTASYVLQAQSASYAATASNAPDYLPLAGGTLTGDLYASGRTFWYQDLILGYGTTFGKITTDGTKYISIMPDYNVESARFWPNGNVTIQNAGTYVDNGFRLDVSGSGRFTDGLTVTGSLNAANGITGSLFGTSSYTINALTSSFASSASYWSGSIINAATASYVQTAQTASYVLNAVSASYASTASYLNPIENSYLVLSQVSQSLNFADDAAAAAGGVPLGGLYRNGNFILIRIV